jgi:hypothetical protein
MFGGPLHADPSRLARLQRTDRLHCRFWGGVDMLAHTFPTELDRRPWDRTLPGMMRERGMALIPTLKLWPYELRKVGLPAPVNDLVLGNGQAQLRAFADIGGQVLFGTDVGYMTDYDPTDEYVYMQQAGLSHARILAALTTAPAARFGAAARTGRIAPGLDADLGARRPPADDISRPRPRATLRGGIHRRAPSLLAPTESMPASQASGAIRFSRVDGPRSPTSARRCRRRSAAHRRALLDATACRWGSVGRVRRPAVGTCRRWWIASGGVSGHDRRGSGPRGALGRPAASVLGPPNRAAARRGPRPAPPCCSTCLTSPISIARRPPRLWRAI